MATYEQVTYNSPDGAQIGKAATEKIGFYGATPVVQASNITAPATTVAVSSGAWGWGSTQANAITTSLDAVITALKNVGIVASS